MTLPRDQQFWLLASFLFAVVIGAVTGGLTAALVAAGGWLVLAAVMVPLGLKLAGSRNS